MKKKRGTILNKYETITPYWITGFSDGESSFVIRITKDDTRKQCWRIKPIFSIELHKKDLNILKKIQKYFGVGNIIFRGRNNNAIYSVQSIKDINNVIIAHFIKYPLLTQKQIDFELFCLAMDVINKKEHLDIKGIKKIISIRASMNKGLTDNLIKFFPDIIKIDKPSIKNKEILNPFWLVGFVDAEGCFYVKIVKNVSSKLKFQLCFSISQHCRDLILMNDISDYLKCGLIEKPQTRKEARFVVYRFNDHLNYIIPFFSKYNLLTVKNLDYNDFRTIANIIKEKKYLTEEDIIKIKTLKFNMNKNRIVYK